MSESKKEMSPIEKDLAMLSKDLYRWREILTCDGMFYAHPKAQFSLVYHMFELMQKLIPIIAWSFGCDFHPYDGKIEYDSEGDVKCDPSASSLCRDVEDWHDDKEKMEKELLKILKKKYEK